VKTLIDLAALLAFFASVASSQEITTESLGPGQFRLVLESPAILDVSSAQKLLLPKALELCEGLEPVLGHYQFRSSAPIEGQAPSNKPTVFLLTQDVACGTDSATTQVDSARNSAFGVVKTDQRQSLEEFVEAASIAYLQQRSEGEFERAYGAFSEAMRSFQPLEEWKKRNADFNAAAGEQKSTSVWRITVYDNPPNAPVPGLYVAADYESEFERVPFQCGYLIWLQSAGRRFAITREESGSLPADLVERLPKEKIVEIRKQFGCPAR
jgi:Protein of unknown function (DUF4019)